jgi:hypothetical protein
MEASLLKSCLSFLKISFSLRTCPISHIREAVSSFDILMFEALSDLVGGPLPEWSWSKANLPVSAGGVGIRSAPLHASAAFIGSYHQCLPLICEMLGHHPAPSIRFASSFADLSLAANQPSWSSLGDIDFPISQRSLSRSINQASFDRLLNDAPDVRSRALALSSAIPHAGDWLNVVPSHSLGLHLHNREFRLCIQYWLGLRMFSESYPCPFCKHLCDPFGDHHIGCGGNNDRIFRHDSLRDILFESARSAALSPKKELPSLIPGSKSRPADIYLPNWKHSKPAALDVSVISPLQKLTLISSSSIQGHALCIGEERKCSAHVKPCHDVGVSFIPMIAETIGGWSEVAVRMFAELRVSLSFP